MRRSTFDHSSSHAVLIGASVYLDQSYPELRAAANSLDGMEKILADPELCDWPTQEITVIRDPVDAPRLIQKIRRIARAATGVLLLYFVGHGTISPRGKLCLVLSDTDAQDPDVTGLEFNWVREALLDSPAQTKIVILDCCYSGRAIEAMSGGSAVADSTDSRGTYTLTASDLVAHVPPLAEQAEAYTSFTGELLDLVRTGVPDGPEYLTLNVIYPHLSDRLSKRSLPEPNRRGVDTADQFTFTRNAAYPVTQSLRPSEHGGTTSTDMAFRLEVFQREELLKEGGTVHAILELGIETGNVPPPVAAKQAVPSAMVIVIDCSVATADSGLLEWMRRVVERTIGGLPPGTYFGVVAGAETARLIYPADRQELVPATAATRAAAIAALTELSPRGDITLSQSLALAHRLLRWRPERVKHATLLVGGSNSGNDEDQLSQVIAGCIDDFTCDCFGVGVEWTVAELRMIADALSGTLDMYQVTDPAIEELSYRMLQATRTLVSDVELSIAFSPQAHLGFLKEVLPNNTEISWRGREFGHREFSGRRLGRTRNRYALGAWAAETRQYHLSLEIDPGDVGERVTAADITVRSVLPDLSPGPATEASVSAMWVEKLTPTIDPRLTQ